MQNTKPTLVRVFNVQERTLQAFREKMSIWPLVITASSRKFSGGKRGDPTPTLPQDALQIERQQADTLKLQTMLDTEHL